jgi:hypothetical protein
MKLDSYWTDSAPAFVPRSCELPAQVDVRHGGRDGRRRARQPLGGPRLARDPRPPRAAVFLPAIGLYYALKDRLA